MNPKDLKGFFRLTETRYSIKLGLADKMWIHKRAYELGLEEGDFNKFIIYPLKNSGYHSPTLKKVIQEGIKDEKDFTNYLLTGHNLPELTNYLSPLSGVAGRNTQHKTSSFPNQMFFQMPPF